MQQHNKYRLSSNAFEREMEQDKIEPQKIFFLISQNHTFVSKEVSLKVHHGKSGINFKKNYMAYIDTAIARAKEFASDETELVDSIGCNIWKLLEAMKNYKLQR